MIALVETARRRKDWSDTSNYSNTTGTYADVTDTYSSSSNVTPAAGPLYLYAFGHASPYMTRPDWDEIRAILAALKKIDDWRRYLGRSFDAKYRQAFLGRANRKAQRNDRSHRPRGPP